MQPIWRPPWVPVFDPNHSFCSSRQECIFLQIQVDWILVTMFSDYIFVGNETLKEIVVGDFLYETVW